MLILQEIYLYKTITNSPFIFEVTQGLDIVMSATDERVIDTLTLETADFFFDLASAGKLEFELQRGFDDIYIENDGQQSGYLTSFELFLYRQEVVNLLTKYDFITLEKLVSSRYSIIIKTNNEFRAIFSEFSALPSNIGDFDKNKIQFKSNEGFGFPYLVENLTVNNIIKSITGC